MKKYLKFLIMLALFIFWLTIPSVSIHAAQQNDKESDKEQDSEKDQDEDISAWSWTWTQDPVRIMGEVKNKANQGGVVQRTDLDVISSKADTCDWMTPDSRFTLTRTLCSVKENIKDYLQYVMYIWLSAATIFLIWNWFKIVTSTDRAKQMQTFKKNLIYIVIWVVLLTWFYYMIDIFVGVVNVLTD